MNEAKNERVPAEREREQKEARQDSKPEQDAELSFLHELWAEWSSTV